jgi:hypothetical protein
MKRWIAAIGIALTFATAPTAWAALAQFNFTFFNEAGAPIGNGFYSFDDITPGNKRSFATLNNFNWAFSVPGYNLDLKSANGDVPSTDSLVNEGIQLSGLPGSRTLQFFDDALTYILHQDVSEAFPSGIEFPEFTNQVSGYWDNGTQLGTGTFTAREVPEPATAVLLASAILLLIKRGNKKGSGGQAFFYSPSFVAYWFKAGH